MSHDDVLYFPRAVYLNMSALALLFFSTEQSDGWWSVSAAGQADFRVCGASHRNQRLHYRQSFPVPALSHFFGKQSNTG